MSATRAELWERRGSADKKEKKRDIKTAEACCWEALMIYCTYTAPARTTKMRLKQEKPFNNYSEINATGK